MTPLDPVTLSFSAALLLGLSFGAGPCNIACLPYLGPVLMSSGQEVRSAWRTLLPFSLGRLGGYALLGAGAGALGLVVQDWIAESWVRWLLGGATMLVAVSLLLRRRSADSCQLPPHRNEPVRLTLGPRPHRPRKMLPGGLFLMGAGMALNPCTALTTVVLAAATSASAGAGLSLGIGFGLGAVLLPGLIFVFGVAHIGSEIRRHLGRWRSTLDKAAIGLLLLLGSATALGWITP